MIHTDWYRDNMAGWIDMDVQLSLGETSYPSI